MGGGQGRREGPGMGARTQGRKRRLRHSQASGSCSNEPTNEAQRSSGNETIGGEVSYAEQLTQRRSARPGRPAPAGVSLFQQGGQHGSVLRRQAIIGSFLFSQAVAAREEERRHESRRAAEHRPNSGEAGSRGGLGARSCVGVWALSSAVRTSRKQPDPQCSA